MNILPELRSGPFRFSFTPTEVWSKILLRLSWKTFSEWHIWESWDHSVVGEAAALPVKCDMMNALLAWLETKKKAVLFLKWDRIKLELETFYNHPNPLITSPEKPNAWTLLQQGSQRERQLGSQLEDSMEMLFPGEWGLGVIVPTGGLSGRWLRFDTPPGIPWVPSHLGWLNSTESQACESLCLEQREWFLSVLGQLSPVRNVTTWYRIGGLNSTTHKTKK